MPIRFEALLTDAVRAVQLGAVDDYGNPPERRVCEGGHMPCRHCMKNIDAGEEYLIVSWRPFESLQPYAETGPLFLHAGTCARAVSSDMTPMSLQSPDYIVRGYDRDERIIYGTGNVVPTERIVERAEQLLEDERVEFVHIRSTQNNCYQCRVDRC